MNPNNPYNPNQQPEQSPAPQTPPPYQTLPTVAVNDTPSQTHAPQPQTPQPWQSQQFPQTPPQQTSAPAQNSWPQQTPSQPPQSMGGAGSPEPSRTPPPRMRRYDKAPLPVRMMGWLKKNWWAPVVGLLILAVVGDVIFQIAQPANALPQGTVISGADVSGMDRSEAVASLNNAYGEVKTEIYFGESTIPYTIPTAKEVGINVDNTSRLENVSYPLWLRLIPTSYMWASSLNNIGEPLYNYDKSTLDTFALKNLGDDCTIEPKNATLKLEDDRFTVVSAVPGGKCNITEFKNAASNATMGDDGKITIRTPINETPAPLTDAIAQQLADELNHNLSRDMPLQAGGKTETVPVRTVKGWLSFKAVIPEAKEGEEAAPPRLAMVIEKERLRKYFDGSIASRVEKKPGVTKIATTDFTETSHTEGASGVLIDLDKTIPTIEAFIGRRANSAVVHTGPVAPTVQYTRTYTPTENGFRALIEQFAHDNKGKIGIVFQEVGGKKPYTSGAANDRIVMKGSGIEATYLAYAAQAGIEDGSIQPTDRIVGSQSVEDCVAAAIERQDYDCSRALLDKVTHARVQQRMQEIGLTSTSFSGEFNTTTARDAATFTQRLLDRDLPIKKWGSLEQPMRNTSLRAGFIGGSSGNVVSFGGEEDGNYSEAGYISLKGRYYVSFVSEGSDAQTAAKLIQAIDKLRLEKSELKGN
ncbi:MAG: serine hydrolase [Candidatus Saccharimonadales bacterium]